MIAISEILMIVGFFLRNQIGTIFIELSIICIANKLTTLLYVTHWFWCNLFFSNSDEHWTLWYISIFGSSKHFLFIQIDSKVQATVLGYSGETFFALLVEQAVALAHGAFILISTSVCIHHFIFYSMFNQSIDRWNRLAKFLCNQIHFCASSKRVSGNWKSD